MTPPHPLDSLSGGSGQQYSAKKKTIYSKSGLEQNKGLGCRTIGGLLEIGLGDFLEMICLYLIACLNLFWRRLVWFIRLLGLIKFIFASRQLSLS